MPERLKPEPAYDSANWRDDELENNGEDPLAELARLVQGVGSPTQPLVRPAPPRSESGTRAPASRFAPPAEPLPVASMPAALDEADLASDLEAELMRDLQASFAAVRAPIADLPQPQDPGPALTDELDFDAFADMHMRQGNPTETPRPAPRFGPERPGAEKADSEKAGIESLATWREGRDGRVRPKSPQITPASTARQRTAEEGGPQASMRAPDRLARRPAESPDPLSADPEIAAAAAAAESFGQTPTAREAFESFQAPMPEEFASVPGYGRVEHPEYEPRPSRAERKMRAERSGGRRGLVLVASLLGVVLLGTLAVFGFKGLSGEGDAGAPPIIAADPGPTKIPATGSTAKAGSDAGKLVYDRVGGDDTAETALAPEEAVTTVPRPEVQRTDASREISRIILPNSGDPLVPEDEATSRAPSAEESAAVGPKRVRTVVVRPDGTIVSSTSAPAPSAAPAAATEINAPAPSRPATTVAPVDTTAGTAQAPLVAEDERAPTAAAPDDGSSPYLQDDWESEAVASDEEPDAATAPPARHAAPAATADTARSSGPISLLPKSGTAETPAEKPAAKTIASAEPSAPAPKASATAGGGYFVQVSSQRSEGAALSSYRDMQRRFPSVLGDREPDIQRADLGAKGVYYRARAGGMSADAASKLCASLKSAGGDCIVTSN